MKFSERYENHRWEHAVQAATGARMRTMYRHTAWTAFVLAVDFRWLMLGAAIAGLTIGLVI